MFTEEQKAEILALIREANKPPAEPPAEPPAKPPADPPAEPPAEPPADALKAENERLKNQVDVLTKLIAAAGAAKPPDADDKAKQETIKKVKNFIQNM